MAQHLKMLEDIERAYELDPMDLSISENLAYQYQLFDRSEDAAKVVERMKELYPDHLRTLNVELSNYLYESQLAKGAQVLYQGRELYPEQPNWKAAVPFMYVKLGIIKEKLDSISLAGAHQQLDFYSQIGHFEKAEELISELEQESPNNAHIQWHIIKHYLNKNEIDSLKLHVDRWIAANESANREWKSQCNYSVILAMQKTDNTDSMEAMLKSCRDGVLKALDAGYYCPCNWISLVHLAILEGRTDEAVERIYEWLDMGSELANIENDPFFNLLKDHPEYDNIIQRNNANLKSEQEEYRRLGINL